MHELLEYLDQECHVLWTYREICALQRWNRYRLPAGPVIIDRPAGLPIYFIYFPAFIIYTYSKFLLIHFYEQLDSNSSIIELLLSSCS